MKQDTTFEEKLAIGTEGEDIVYDLLVARNRWVMDCRSMNHGVGYGPRLKGTEGTAALPDFIVKNKKPKESYAVDAKVKSKLYDIRGKLCFSVDKKLDQYRKVAQLFELDYVAIIFVYDNKLYMYKDTEFCDTTEYNNEYGTGTVYFFEFDSKKQIY